LPSPIINVKWKAFVRRCIGHLLETKGGDSKEGIITIYVPDIQSQDTLAAKHLQEIISTLGALSKMKFHVSAETVEKP